MYVAVIKNEKATTVLIVDSEDDELINQTESGLRDWLSDNAPEQDYTYYESDDVVLTIDGNKVND